MNLISRNFFYSQLGPINTIVQPGAVYLDHHVNFIKKYENLFLNWNSIFKLKLTKIMSTTSKVEPTASAFPFLLKIKQKWFLEFFVSFEVEFSKINIISATLKWKTHHDASDKMRNFYHHINSRLGYYLTLQFFYCIRNGTYRKTKIPWNCKKFPSGWFPFSRQPGLFANFFSLS